MFKKTNFVERSVRSALSFLKEATFADDIASKKGLLQSIDPRVKTITFLLFIVQIVMTKDLFIVVCLYALCLVLVLCSKINLGFLLEADVDIYPPVFAFHRHPRLVSCRYPRGTVDYLQDRRVYHRYHPPRGTGGESLCCARDDVRIVCRAFKSHDEA